MPTAFVHGGRSVTVTREEAHQAELAGLPLGRVGAELGFCLIAGGKYRGLRGVEVRIGGRRVGELTFRMSAQYAELVAEAADRGEILGCVATIDQGERGRQVTLWLPEPVELGGTRAVVVPPQLGRSPELNPGATTALPTGATAFLPGAAAGPSFLDGPTAFVPGEAPLLSGPAGALLSGAPEAPLGSPVPAPHPGTILTSGEPRRGSRRRPMWPLGIAAAVVAVLVGVAIATSRGGEDEVTASAPTSRTTAPVTSVPPTPAEPTATPGPSAAPTPVTGTGRTGTTARGTGGVAAGTTAPAPPVVVVQPVVPQQPAAAPAPLPEVPAAETTAPVTPTTPANGCNPNYGGCVPNRADVSCSEIGHQVKVTGTDVYGLDADGDGIGCESLPAA